MGAVPEAELVGRYLPGATLRAEHVRPHVGLLRTPPTHVRASPAPDPHRLQDRPGADVQVPGRAYRRGSDPLRNPGQGRIEAHLRAAAPLPGAPEPPLRLLLPPRCFHPEVPDRRRVLLVSCGGRLLGAPEGGR